MLNVAESLPAGDARRKTREKNSYQALAEEGDQAVPSCSKDLVVDCCRAAQSVCESRAELNMG